MSVKIIVINGSNKGLITSNLLNKYSNRSEYKILNDISEEFLTILEEIHPKHQLKAYYLYDPVDLEGLTIHDVGLPMMRLYDDFININNTKKYT